MQVQRCKPRVWIEWDGIVLVRYFPVAGDFFVTGRHAPPHVDRRADRCGPSDVIQGMAERDRFLNAERQFKNIEVDCAFE